MGVVIDAKQSLASIKEIDDHDTQEVAASVVVVHETSLPDIHITGKETDQDLVDRFNEYYRNHKQKTAKDTGDSVSSTAVTQSQLLRSRECRRVLMRRLLIFVSLCLYGVSLLFAIIWLLIVYIWPVQFALNVYVKEKYKLDITHDTVSYTILGITVIHAYILGSWGLMSASCGQDRCLKRFMLTAPWFLIISIFCGFMAITFIGTLSQHQLKKTMEDNLGKYFHRQHDTDNYSKNGWDKMQLYFRCCGVESAEDWTRVNTDLDEKLPKTCCMNSKGRRQNNETLVEVCIRDPHMRHIFPIGCKDKAFEFVTLVGAGVTALCFLDALLILFAVQFSTQFYILKMKVRLGHFAYPLKEYMIDFLYIRKCVTIIRRRRKRKKPGAEKGKVGVAGKDGVKIVEDDDDDSLFDYDNLSALVEKMEQDQEAAEVARDKEIQEEMMKRNKGRRSKDDAPTSNKSQKKGHDKTTASNKKEGKKDVNFLYQNPRTSPPYNSSRSGSDGQLTITKRKPQQPQ